MFHGLSMKLHLVHSRTEFCQTVHGQHNWSTQSQLFKDPQLGTKQHVIDKWGLPRRRLKVASNIGYPRIEISMIRLVIQTIVMNVWYDLILEGVDLTLVNSSKENGTLCPWSLLS